MGFLLLEEVEGALGSSEQTLQWVGLDNLDGVMLSALKARMLRGGKLGGFCRLLLLHQVSLRNCKLLFH